MTEMLDNAFFNKKYEDYVKLMDEYLNEGYKPGMRIYIQYINVLTNLKRYDEAYNLIKRLENTAKNEHLESSFARLLLYAYKPVEAEDLLRHKSDFSYTDYYLLAKIYVMQGQLDNAKRCAKIALNTAPEGSNTVGKSKELIKKINNNYFNNAYLECEYESFINNGNTLEPGHIVFLKHKVDKMNGKEELTDSKSLYRPYMIWKIDNDKLYMFPVATKRDNELSYVLYSHDYPNNNTDRVVKDNLCVTTIDNVLSVQDKVKDEDYKNVLKSIYKTTYFTKHSDERDAKQMFMREIMGDAKVDNVILSIDPITKEKQSYFVKEVYEDGYLVLPYNHKDKILDNTPIIFKKSDPIIHIFIVNEQELSIIKSQLNENNNELKKILD